MSKFDFFPNQKIAGITQRIDGDSAANCLAGLKIGSSTPPHIKKYRKSYKQQAGTTILHYGVADDVINKDKAFGISNKDSDHASQCLQNHQNDGINQLVNEIKENKYASRHKEPLGQKMERNYIFPEEVNDQQFKFGVVTQHNKYTGKEVMFPTEQIPQSQDALDNYIKSYGDQRVAVQKTRNYNWGSIDKNDHRFGKAENNVPNEIQYCLNAESLADQFPNTTIVQKKQEDFRNYRDDPLGKSKNLAQVNQYVNENTVYGARPNQMDKWNVGQCIRGEATLKEAVPDKDLGKTNKFGFRNTAKQGDENRVFGVPTIRDDIQKKGMKSVADPINYGDEPAGIELLFPQPYDHIGVEQSDFLKLRPKQEIRSIFDSIGTSFKTGKFEGIYARAKQIQNSQDDRVSVRAFQAAVAEMGHLD